MKTDYSRIFYNKYFGLANRNIEVRMKNGKIIQGIIIGFYRSCDDDAIPCITRWHIVDEKDKMCFGTDSLGCMTGQIIKQKEIASVKFFDDDTTMNFN